MTDFAAASTNVAAQMSRLRLQAEITYWRYGWLPAAAVVVVACAILAGLFYMPVQQSRYSQAVERLQKAEADRKVGGNGKKQIEPALIVFQRTLSAQDQTNDLIRQIFHLARDNGINITQSDYRRVNEPSGGVSQLQMALPVHTDYVSLRKFIREVLAKIPSLSLDQIAVKREQLMSNQSDAQLFMTLWQRVDGAGLQAGAR